MTGVNDIVMLVVFGLVAALYLGVCLGVSLWSEISRWRRTRARTRFHASLRDDDQHADMPTAFFICRCGTIAEMDIDDGLDAIMDFYRTRQAHMAEHGAVAL